LKIATRHKSDNYYYNNNYYNNNNYYYYYYYSRDIASWTARSVTWTSTVVSRVKHLGM